MPRKRRPTKAATTTADASRHRLLFRTGRSCGCSLPRRDAAVRRPSRLVHPRRVIPVDEAGWARLDPVRRAGDRRFRGPVTWWLVGRRPLPVSGGRPALGQLYGVDEAGTPRWPARRGDRRRSVDDLLSPDLCGCGWGQAAGRADWGHRLPRALPGRHHDGHLAVPVRPRDQPSRGLKRGCLWCARTGDGRTHRDSSSGRMANKSGLDRDHAHLCRRLSRRRWTAALARSTDKR